MQSSSYRSCTWCLALYSLCNARNVDHTSPARQLCWLARTGKRPYGGPARYSVGSEYGVCRLRLLGSHHQPKAGIEPSRGSSLRVGYRRLRRWWDHLGGLRISKTKEEMLGKRRAQYIASDRARLCWLQEQGALCKENDTRVNHSRKPPGSLRRWR